jgi:hypothetical protein
MPVFSADGRSISQPHRESRDRDAIWVFDAATGKSRVAVRFAEPFTMYFRASWVDDDCAFLVNRYRQFSSIVMFDRLGSREQRGQTPFSWDRVRPARVAPCPLSATAFE